MTTRNQKLIAALNTIISIRDLDSGDPSDSIDLTVEEAIEAGRWCDALRREAVEHGDYELVEIFDLIPPVDA